MTAPATTGTASCPHEQASADVADLPPWLPPLVAVQAPLTYADAVSPRDADVIKYVTANERMKGVWQHLQKRRRDPKEGVAYYAYPVRGREVSARCTTHFAKQLGWTLTELVQQAGLAELYVRATNVARIYYREPGLSPLPDRASLVSWREAIAVLDQVDRLLEWADPRFALPDYAAKRMKVVSLLTQAHAALIDIEGKRGADDADRLPRMVVRQIAQKMRALFGTVMFSHTAVITSVILRQEISAGYVRNLIRGPWEILTK